MGSDRSERGNMTTVVHQNSDILQYFFDALNSGDIERMKAVFKEYYSTKFRLHYPGSKKPEMTFQDYLDFIGVEIGKASNVKWETQDFLRDGERTATRGMFTRIDLETNELHKEAVIFITRFEDGKVMEEWELSAPIK